MIFVSLKAYLLSRSSFTPSDQAGGIIGGMGALGLIPRVAGLRPVTTVTSVPPLVDQGSPVASASSPASSDGGVGPLTTVVQPIPKGGGGIQNLSTHARDLLNVALGLRLAASRKLHEACQVWVKLCSMTCADRLIEYERDVERCSSWSKSDHCVD